MTVNAEIRTQNFNYDDTQNFICNLKNSKIKTLQIVEK